MTPHHTTPHHATPHHWPRLQRHAHERTQMRWPLPLPARPPFASAHAVRRLSRARVRSAWQRRRRWAVAMGTSVSAGCTRGTRRGVLWEEADGGRGRMFPCRAALRDGATRRRHCAAHNDMFVKKADGRIGTSTNRSGGIQGGRVPPMYGACSVQDAPWDVIACNVQHATCNMQLTAYNVAVAGSAFARRSRTARTLSSPSRLSRRRRSARRRSSPIRGRTTVIPKIRTINAVQHACTNSRQIRSSKQFGAGHDNLHGRGDRARGKGST